MRLALLKVQMSGHRAKNLSLCFQSLASDLKPQEATIRKSPSSWLPLTHTSCPIPFVEEGMAWRAWLLFLEAIKSVPEK